jgi:hypothetical protein
MALKILNTTLTPLGLFDLIGDDTSTAASDIAGGEHVVFDNQHLGEEGYAADVPSLGLTSTTYAAVAPGQKAAGGFSGLADDGQGTGYGTLFGELIGSNTGSATSVSGAVVIGPATHRASGKVTVWATPGLYGITGRAATAAASPLSAMTTNAAVYATSTGLLTSGSNGTQVAIYVGRAADTSLVSTTASAAGLTPTVEYYAVFFLGAQS